MARRKGWGLAVAGLVAVWGCGGGSGYGTPPPSGNPPPMATQTISLTSAGVSMSALTVAAASQIAFVNNDSVSHEVASNPHPQHTDCPELNGPMLAPGASFTASMANKAETCGFHDHLNPGNTAFQGTITVKAPGY